MTKPPLPFQHLVAILRKLPGVGAKTAERYAFALLDWEEHTRHALAEALSTLSQRMTKCSTCFCLQGDTACEFCNQDKRDSHTLCIISSAKDVYPIEETQIFRGIYHVLEGLFSPLQGKGASLINMKRLHERIKQHQVTHVILALDSTLEGDATSLFLKQEMAEWNISISRLAFGLPLGSSLDYIDPGTLTRAFLGRSPF
ncbi:MAG: recombination protein RecR [Chlamydiae bacterium]|nr:recombination protein RecR [Chlamydiota bacterium]